MGGRGGGGTVGRSDERWAGNCGRDMKDRIREESLVGRSVLI